MTKAKINKKSKFVVIKNNSSKNDSQKRKEKIKNFNKQNLMRYYLKERETINENIETKILNLNKFYEKTIALYKPTQMSKEDLEKRKNALYIFYSFLEKQTNNLELNQYYIDNIISKYERLYYKILAMYDYYLMKSQENKKDIYFDLFTCFYIQAKLDNISLYQDIFYMTQTLIGFYQQIYKKSIIITQDELNENQNIIINTIKADFFPICSIDYFCLLGNIISQIRKENLDLFNEIVRIFKEENLKYSLFQLDYSFCPNKYSIKLLYDKIKEFNNNNNPILSKISSFLLKYI